MPSLLPATYVAALNSWAKATSRARKAALFLVSVALLLVGGAAAVHGQSALDGFVPNANGRVTVFAVQSDGKILIGGDFTTVSPNGGLAVTRNRIARLNPDGTLDTAFNPNANEGVSAIAVQADGKILVGGTFTNIGGQARNYIARLNATTGAADSFNPNANDAVGAIAVQADGKILVGGAFTNIGGTTRNRIARLDATTGLADSFDPNASGPVFLIRLQADGKILVGGFFTNIGGQMRYLVARLDATTGLADSFDANITVIPFSTVNSLAVQADGKVLVGGAFYGVGGQPHSNFARLNPDGTVDVAFNANTNGAVLDIAVQADGKILVAGGFSDIGGTARNHIARLDGATGLPDSFNPNADSTVFAIAVQPDGKILASGFFNNIGGQARNQIARLEADGRLDRTLDLNMVATVGQFGYVEAIAVQPDGKILIGGQFTTVLGVTRRNIARLNADGTLDTAFNPNPNNDVASIAVQADGKILVGGQFTSIGGQTRNRIARLDATTGLADSFNPNANDPVYSIVVQADGKILVGGHFTEAISSPSIGGQPRNRIARLDPTTGLADSFDPNANSLRPLNRGAGGRQDSGGRRFHEHRRTGAQSHRPARCHDGPG